MPNSATIPPTGSTQATPDLYNDVVKDAIRIVQVAGADKTIASGAITVSPSSGEGHYEVDTEASAAYDDLDTINGGSDGDVITLQSVNSGRIIRVRHGVGNIILPGEVHTALDTVETIMLRHNGTNWVAIRVGNKHVFTNKSGATVNAGDVLIFDDANDLSFKTTTVANDPRAFAIAAQSIPNNGTGFVHTIPGNMIQVNCTSAAVSRGQFLGSAGSTGKAQSAGFFMQQGVFAIALSAKSAGSEGQVYAMLLHNFRQVVTGNTGYALGGRNGSGARINTVQKLNLTTATWSNVPGAALPGGTGGENAGLTNVTTSAIALGGIDNSTLAWNMPFSTEVSALQASANLTTGRQYLRSSGSGSAKGYVAGGGLTNVDVCTYATLTTAVSTVLTSARQYQAQVSDGVNSYARGGTSVVCDKITIATGAVAANASGNLPALNNDLASSAFASSAGYNTATGLCRKITFSTGTDSNVTSTPSSHSTKAYSATDGINIAYIGGSETSSYDQGYKLDQTTETWSAAASLSTPAHSGAQASVGTYS